MRLSGGRTRKHALSSIAADFQRRKPSFGATRRRLWYTGNFVMPEKRLKVCAVSYLNTVPLVWGMLHGEQRGRFDLLFRIPAQCADLLASGEADVGIVPCFELLRQDLEVLPGLGIACRGDVRSILLVSRRPAGEIRRLAADSSSRTSVALARIILQRRYGVVPEVVAHPPDLPAMLENADAALLIGDPALRVDPAKVPYRVYDLGGEWMEMTGLPMVFAVWAGQPGKIDEGVARAFRESCTFGLRHLEDIVRAETGPRGFDEELVRRYLTRHIVFELGPEERRGMELYLRYAADWLGLGTGTGTRGV